MDVSAMSTVITRGTTPTTYIVINGTNLDGAIPYVTIKQDEIKITKSGRSLIIVKGGKCCILRIELSQEETLSLKDEKKAYLQVRWVYEDGRADATEEQSFSVDSILKEGVIAHE